jgi:biofilm PGA synthesis N-glycosyltransferase PgaC
MAASREPLRQLFPERLVKYTRLTLLFYLFVAASITQLLFWMLIFSRLALYRAPPPANSERRPVSVIICARNEAENLEKNLRHILSQNYRSFEVIVVNHHSQDRTPEILLEFQNKWPNFRIVHFDEPKPGKKAALQAGIAAARHDLILLTDADCVPASERWISQAVGVGL